MESSWRRSASARQPPTMNLLLATTFY
jgi:hypothetical protein